MSNKLSSNHFQYGKLEIDPEQITSSPLDLFQSWLDDYLSLDISNDVDMVVSTVDHEGRPDSRVVILRGFQDGQFIFYTNYLSQKGRQIDLMPYAALNFYWRQFHRQIRVKGLVNKISAEQSDNYFYSRPIASQVSAILSDQSQVIASRLDLEKSVKTMLENKDVKISRPENWGGYSVVPYEIEFWQGRDDRIHDRIQYLLQNNGTWHYSFLAP